MKQLIIILLTFFSLDASAQDISYNRSIVDTLTSPVFWGRGYTKDGMKKAADFLSSEFKTLGLQPLSGNDFFQPFSYPVNTFPGKMKVKLNGKKLVPGVDFIVTPESRGMRTSAKLEDRDSSHFMNQQKRIMVTMVKKLTWSAEEHATSNLEIEIDKNKFTAIPKKIKVNIQNEENPKFDANNICAFVKGTEKPDSFIFITAHYDHLGGMGSNTYFPGANDNASGVALLLSMAKYYVSHPQKYSIGFILFAGEEIGLLGSKYYTQHPLQPLKNIRFLINTDLAGTGDDGITVVNATLFPAEFEKMTKINEENKYLPSIGARGKAANSDHYWFTEKGVPAFFFYTKGGIAAYHDVFDRGATLPLNKQAVLKELLVKFIGALQD